MPIQYDSIAAVLHRPGFEGPQQLRGYIYRGPHGLGNSVKPRFSRTDTGFLFDR